MGEEWVVYWNVLLAPTVFLDSVGAVTRFGSLLCPSRVPDQVT